MLIVDAYNVLHTALTIESTIDWDLAELRARIALSRYRSRAALIVCDGTRTGATEPLNEHANAEAPSAASRRKQGRAEAQTIYAGSEQEADDIIEQILASRRGAIAILVVSSDRRLHRAARAHRAQFVESSTFLRELLADTGRRPAPARPAFAQEVPLDRYSLAHWLREFGFSTEELLAGPLAPPPSVSKLRLSAGQVNQPATAPEARRRPTSETHPRAAPQAPARRERPKPDFGERLKLPVPEAPPAPAAAVIPPVQPPAPAPVPASTPEPAAESPDEASPDAGAREAWVDDALSVWAQRLSPDDLNMDRWLADAANLPPGPTPTTTPKRRAGHDRARDDREPRRSRS
ncbi:MAG: NYN domain-containing protein [Planctomycetota bacterium]|nr:NYN domain-containing protein [Planctomycetota bacterium]